MFLIVFVFFWNIIMFPKYAEEVKFIYNKIVSFFSSFKKEEKVDLQASSSLKFGEFVLSETTLSEVYETKGEPKYFDKKGKYVRLVYIKNIFEKEGVVMYDFYDDVLIAGIYGVNFRNYEISEINQFFNQLKHEIEQEYGTGRISFEGTKKTFERNLNLDDEEMWKYITGGIVEIRIDWNINNKYWISLWASGDMQYLYTSIILAYYIKTASIHFLEEYVKGN
ncbi:hypothetical protein SAMN02745199_0510 [Thermosipho atlanticus DSM 15807]|uniref:Uncharacterized protein n=1 Tax=Thermosipho atlanticus DSM 15807 TaxID=1123380 RepID=A0A1M5RN14_9BACT|nr:hypothetical protein SAMN02745199_0510 [Thermosipho atlanticus DSM 15807]